MKFEEWRNRLFDDPKYLGKDLALEAWNYQQAEISRLLRINKALISTMKDIAKPNIERKKSRMATAIECLNFLELIKIE